MQRAKIAIVAALEREVSPLVKHWRIAKRTYDGCDFKFFEHEDKILICGGIGAEPGRRATEAAIQLYNPKLMISAGFAGALDPKLKVGDILILAFVIDANDGSRLGTGTGSGALVSSPSIAGPGQKAKLATAYGADAVDMEGAAVGRGAQTHGVPFMAVKSVSDEFDFELPPMQKFVGTSGQFRNVAFAMFVTVRPWLWMKTFTLYRNSVLASKSLCKWLAEQDLQKLQNARVGTHPIKASSTYPNLMAIADQGTLEGLTRKIPATMQAAVYRGINDVRLETVPTPKIGPGELLIRVHTCGVCGTDLKKIASGSHSAPRIFGHETSGVVAAKGAGVNHFKPGDRVVVFHHIPCGNCFYCERKTFAQCETYKKVGCTAGFEPSGGGFAEYVRVMDWIVERGTVPIPDKVSFEQACFVEPVNTCIKGIERLHLAKGESVLVIGQGSIGILLAALAKRAGARVITSDLHDQRLTISKELGFEESIDASRADVVAGVRKLTDGRGADAAILAVGSNGLIKTAMEVVRPGGRVLLFAQTARGEVTIDPAAVCVDEKTLLGSYSASVDLQEASVRFVMGREMNLERLISHRFPLSQSREALELAAHPQPDSMKIVIQPGSSWSDSNAEGNS